LNYKSYLNSNEGKKEEGILSYGEYEYFFFFFFFKREGFFFFNSNEDSGAKFWVHFKMKPKF
jgi:hypothetical protein